MERGRIPNRLKKYRRLAGLTQQEAARIIGLKSSAPLSRWERGHGAPGIYHLLGLSFLYKTLPNHLYHDLCRTIKNEITAAEGLLARNELITLSSY